MLQLRHVQDSRTASLGKLEKSCLTLSNWEANIGNWGVICEMQKSSLIKKNVSFHHQQLLNNLLFRCLKFWQWKGLLWDKSFSIIPQWNTKISKRWGNIFSLLTPTLLCYLEASQGFGKINKDIRVVGTKLEEVWWKRRAPDVWNVTSPEEQGVCSG